MNDITAPKMHLVCPHCNATNRAPADKLQAELNCGQCHASLLNALPDNLGAAAFNAQLAKSDLPLVVDFWAPWCGPCLALGPTIESLATEYDGKVNIGKVNTDENSELSIKYGITSIPCVLFIKDGKVVDKQVGAVPKAALERKIVSHI